MTHPDQQITSMSNGDHICETTRLRQSATPPEDASGDLCALRAAAQVHQQIGHLTPARRRIALTCFNESPAKVSDPRRREARWPLVSRPQQAVQSVLATAGGDCLQGAARRVNEWAGPAVALSDLQSLLACWLPAGAMPGESASVTRRLICDTAGLVVAEDPHAAVSADTLHTFAEAAMGLADDAWLIDEARLVAFADSNGWAAHFDHLAASCGLVRVSGLLAVRDNKISASKAALVRLGRPATAHEAAALSGRHARTTAHAFSTCDSILRVDYRLWVAVDVGADTGPISTAATTAARRTNGTSAPQAQTQRAARQQAAYIAFDCADDAGLIDETQLRHALAELGINGSRRHIAEMCKLTEVRGHLAPAHTTAPAGTVAAATKATLLALGRAASASELTQRTGRKYKAVSNACVDTASIVKVASNLWHADTADGALGRFAAAAAKCQDEPGLIDEAKLKDLTAADIGPERYDEMVTACAFPRVGGRLAAADTHRARVVAALLNLDRPARTVEIAEHAAIAVARASAAISQSAAVVSVGPPGGPRLWIHRRSRGGLFAAFAAAVNVCSDDVGLIDEERLSEIAAANRWDLPLMESLSEACGLKRLHGRLALAETAAAAAKSALLAMARPATLEELTEATGHRYNAIRAGCADSRSVKRIAKGTRGSKGLLAVL